MKELIRILKELGTAPWPRYVSALVLVLLLAALRFSEDWPGVARAGVFVAILVGAAYTAEILYSRHLARKSEHSSG
jgi:hypothetical protein